MIATDLQRRRHAIAVLRIAREYAYETQTTAALIRAVDEVLLAHPADAMTPPAPDIVPPHTLETAACIWEDILGRMASEEYHPLVERCREVSGTWGLRLTALGWIDALDAAWVKADTDPATSQRGHYGLSFDWDFVPDWITRNIEWYADGTLPTVRIFFGEKLMRPYMQQISKAEYRRRGGGRNSAVTREQKPHNRGWTYLLILDHPSA